MKYFISLILSLMLVLPARLRAQDIKLTENDSIKTAVLDSVEIEYLPEAAKQDVFKPNPTKAVIFSAIFPGLGQIYNRKYWKLPIVYGGFLGCVYAITWNGNQYSGYRNAYNDFTDSNDATNSWRSYVLYRWRTQEGWEDQKNWSADQSAYFTRALKRQKDFHRRNRDLSYIVTIGVYALCMLDAYVDAQLFDFDISPDLSLRLDPIVLPETTANSRSFGLQCSLKF